MLNPIFSKILSRWQDFDGLYLDEFPKEIPREPAKLSVIPQPTDAEVEAMAKFFGEE